MKVDSGVVTVGSDILEIVGIAMYSEPLVIFRELIQNAADGIERALSEGVLVEDAARIDITFDREARSVRVRDNGCGLKNEVFQQQMLALGASAKRGESYRGFRGIGRLAGLGHCSALTFRSKSQGDSYVYEARWDSVAVRDLIVRNEIIPLQHLVENTVAVSRTDGVRDDHFFEVILEGVRRLSDDRLFDVHRVTEYLSQVAPVPFHSTFASAYEIASSLRRRAPLLEIDVRVNGQQVFKPYTDEVPIRGGRSTRVKSLELIEVESRDATLAAFGWIVHTDYLGALSSFPGRGLRIRSGNLQVGDSEILAKAFPEERFNAWTIGEFHVYDPRLRPNARRDAFEPSVHVDNFFNQLIPHGVSIVRRCRQESQRRNTARRLRQLQAALDLLNGHLTRNRSALADSVRKYLGEHLTEQVQGLESVYKEKAFTDDLIAKQIQKLKRDLLRVLRLRGTKPLSQRDRGHLDAVRWMRETGREDLIGPYVAAMKSL